MGDCLSVHRVWDGCGWMVDSSVLSFALPCEVVVVSRYDEWKESMNEPRSRVSGSSVEVLN